MPPADDRLYWLVLGAVIEHERRRLKLTQLKFGKSLGVTQATVSRIESGSYRMDVRMYERLPKAIRAKVPPALDSVRDALDQLTKASGDHVANTYPRALRGLVDLVLALR